MEDHAAQVVGMSEDAPSARVPNHRHGPRGQVQLVAGQVELLGSQTSCVEKPTTGVS
jgi:hypothetical protein